MKFKCFAIHTFLLSTIDFVYLMSILYITYSLSHSCVSSDHSPLTFYNFINISPAIFTRIT